jgi:asparagine synthase (glutamine-hydrolysing)
VSLTGHGGDEIFAGYPAQFATAFGTPCAFPPGPTPPGHRGALKWLRLRRLLRGQGYAGLLGKFGLGNPGTADGLTQAERLWVSLHCGPPPSRSPFLHPRFRRGLGGYSPVDEYLRDFREAPTDEVLDRCLHHDLCTYLPQLLHKEDRASMAVSLESRVPLLDHELLEFLATVPPEQKVSNGEPKGLLRAAGRHWLPPEIVERRDKSPFPVPLQQWIAADLGKHLRTVLAEERTRDRQVFHPAELDNPCLEPELVLSMATLELWFRIFIDGELPAAPLPPARDWWAEPVQVF